MLIKAQLHRAPLCGRLCNFQIPARIRLPAHESGHSASLKRFGKRNNKILSADRRPSVCSSTVKELAPLTQSPAGNPLARLYVALLPGTHNPMKVRIILRIRCVREKNLCPFRSLADRFCNVICLPMWVRCAYERSVSFLKVSLGTSEE